jgi:hypothetical protein
VRAAAPVQPGAPNAKGTPPASLRDRAPARTSLRRVIARQRRPFTPSSRRASRSPFPSPSPANAKGQACRTIPASRSSEAHAPQRHPRATQRFSRTTHLLPRTTRLLPATAALLPRAAPLLSPTARGLAREQGKHERSTRRTSRPARRARQPSLFPDFEARFRCRIGRSRRRSGRGIAWVLWNGCCAKSAKVYPPRVRRSAAAFSAVR